MKPYLTTFHGVTVQCEDAITHSGLGIEIIDGSVFTPISAFISFPLSTLPGPVVQSDWQLMRRARLGELWHRSVCLGL